MRWWKRAWAALAIASAGGVWAQSPQPVGAPAGGQPAAAAPAVGSPGTAATLQDACIGALHGQFPANVDRDQLMRQCESLLRAAAAGSGPGASAATSQAPAQAGRSVLAAFGEAGSELLGRPAPGAPQGMGMVRGGPVRNTLTTNPIGWFNGTGMNLQYTRSVRSKLSWNVGGRYSSTDATNGSVSSFGAAAGVDVYLIGAHNEGVRLGPRLSFDVGRETFQGTTTFGRLGAAAELGYSFVATNGVTAQLAGGFGFRLAGDRNDVFNNSFTGGDAGPYVALNVGYSW